MSPLRMLLVTAALAAACAPAAHAQEASDEPADVTEETFAPAEETPEPCVTDEPAPEGDESVEAESCDEEEPAEDSILAELDTDRQFLEDVLADGVVACGSVKAARAATVVRELRLGGAVKANAAVPGRRAKARKGALVAKVTRKVTKAGTVELTCRLTKQGRRVLRGRDGVTLTMRTTVKRKRLKPVVTTGTLSLV